MPLLCGISLHRLNKKKTICQYMLLSFSQFGILSNYDLILSHLNFRTLYSTRRHIDALFLINVFKSKINCQSFMDTVGIRVPRGQIR
jgi:hypothetical protein